MDNDFYGAIFSLNYKTDQLNAVLGGGWNKYDGDHFGKVIWVRNYVGALNPEQEYYRNNGKKTDGNLYLKADYSVNKHLSLYGDVQYRHINYQIKGANDNWDWNTAAMQKLNVDETFDFLNPKAGINWQINQNNRAYASFSVAQKEPTRNNYTDGKAAEHPQAERLQLKIS